MDSLAWVFLLLFVHLPLSTSDTLSKRTLSDLFCIIPNTKGGTVAKEFFKDDKITDAKFYQDYLQDVNVEVYGMQGKMNGVVFYLNNWIHIVVNTAKVVKDKGPYTAVFIQAEDNQYVGFGQFSSCPTKSCEQSLDKSVNFPLETQFLPCRYFYSVEPLPQNIYAYTEAAEKLGLAKRSQEINLFWKFSHNLCNHPQVITFRAIFVWGDKAYPAREAKIKLTNKFPKLGPAPSIFPEEIVDYESDLVDNFEWVESVKMPDGPLLIDDDKMPKRECEEPRNWKNELWDPYELDKTKQRPMPEKRGTTFNCVGRPIQAGVYVVPMSRCRIDLDTTEFEFKSRALKKYSNLGEKLPYTDLGPYKDATIRLFESCINCVAAIPVKSDLEAALEPVSLGGAPMSKKGKFIKGLPLDRFPGSDVWNFRFWHAFMSILATMFVTPVSFFMTRYYKESFNDKTIMFTRIWYAVHLLAIAVNFQLHLCSWFAAHLGRSMLGYSLHDLAFFHRHIGYSALGIFVLMIILGGFRPYDPTLRGICIFLHWFFGIAYHICCVVCMFLAVDIPGSPLYFRIEENDEPFRYFAYVMLIIWVIIEIVFYLMMTMMQVIIDKKNGIVRTYYASPIPVIYEGETKELPGFGFRKSMLFSYIMVTILNCTVMCVALFAQIPNGRNLGPMSCSHNETNFSDDAIDEC